MGYLDRITKMRQNKGIRNAPKKFPWRGEEFTILEITEIWSKETGEKFSPQKLRWRLTKTNNDVQAALEWKAPKAKVRQPVPLLCPDGVRRTRSEIAKLFNLTKDGFEGRYARLGKDLNKVWAIGVYVKPEPIKPDPVKPTPVPIKPTPVPIKPAPVEPKKELTAEQIRCRNVLAKLPSPSKFEEELWNN